MTSFATPAAVRDAVAVPTPIRIGLPTLTYPWRWSVCPWLDGDLHPANILVRDGNICAVIDFGDLDAGDPATDLSVAGMLLDFADRSLSFVRHA